MAKELEVRNLQISFKTNNGNVRAVRDISFDLDKGETLAIVGESGSGKSVTAKAMLGILAGNSIVEGGEIIYNGEDLLKYTEKDFNKIRGNKFTMIFQDPLSSLDPIMRIGKQMTEATILNGRTNQKNAKKEFNDRIVLLKKVMTESGIAASETNPMISSFVKYIKEGSMKESQYREAIIYLESAIMTLRHMIVDVYGEDAAVVEKQYKEFCDKLAKAESLKLVLSNDIKEQKEKLEKLANTSNPDAAKACIERALEAIQMQIDAETPQFYDGSFEMTSLLKNTAKALEDSDNKHRPLKEEAIKVLKENRKVFDKEALDKKESYAASKVMSAAVSQSIDRLSLQKNSEAYTFHTTMAQNLKRYFEGVVRNPKELKRVEKQTIEREKKLKKTNSNVPKVVPAQIVDLELTRKNILKAIDKLTSSYEAELADTTKKDYAVLAEQLLQYLNQQALEMVTRVTKQQAYDKAIRIMEDVGIKEPEKRFRQYPFEFSGGMRQRIVIAIAVAANPDILICDEPTTALDVTIQSQILELINDVKRRRNISVIFITHDLGVVANMADKVAVMYAGKIVEYGTVEEIFYEPKHPYTWALLGSMPDLETKEKLEAIPGTPPNMIYPPKGDAFADRNQYAMQIDFEEQPPMFKVSDTHYAATWLLHPDAPKVDPPKIVTDRIERMKKLEAEK